jgi:hypothetical protein
MFALAMDTDARRTNANVMGAAANVKRLWDREPNINVLLEIL